MVVRRCLVHFQRLELRDKPCLECDECLRRPSHDCTVAQRGPLRLWHFITTSSYTSSSLHHVAAVVPPPHQVAREEEHEGQRE